MNKHRSSSQDLLKRGKQGNEDQSSPLLLESADIGSALEFEETPVSSMEEQSKSKELPSSKYSTPSVEVGSEAIISGLTRGKRGSFTRSGDLELSRTQSTSDRMLLSSASRLVGSPKGNRRRQSVQSEEFTELAKIISQVTGKELKTGPDFPFTLITLMKNGSPVIAHFLQTETKIQNYKELIVTIDKQNNELREKLQVLVTQYTELVNQPPQSPIKRSESSRWLKIDDDEKKELKARIEELEDKNFDLNQELLTYNSLKEENEELKRKTNLFEKELLKHGVDTTAIMAKNTIEEGKQSSLVIDVNISTAKEKSNERLFSELDHYLDESNNDEKNREKTLLKKDDSSGFNESLLNEIGGTKESLTFYNEEVKKYKAEAERLRNQIIEMKHKAKEDVETIDRMKESVRNLMREKQENVSKLVDMKAKVQRAKQKKKEALKTMEQTKEKIKEVKYVDPETEKNLEKALEEIKDIKNDNKRLKNIISEQRDQMANKDGDIEQIKEKLSNAFADIDILKQTIKNKEAEIISAKIFAENISNLAQYKDYYLNTKKELQETQDKYQIEINRFKVTITEMSTKLDALKSVELEKNKTEEALKTTEKLIDVKEKIINKLMNDINRINEEKKELEDINKKRKFGIIDYGYKNASCSNNNEIDIDNDESAFEEEDEKSRILRIKTKEVEKIETKLDNMTKRNQKLESKYKMKTKAMKKQIRKLNKENKSLVKISNRVRNNFKNLVQNYNELVDKYNEFVSYDEKINELHHNPGLQTSSFMKNNEYYEKMSPTTYKLEENSDLNEFSKFDAKPARHIPMTEDDEKQQHNTNKGDMSCELSDWKNIVNSMKNDNEKRSAFNNQGINQIQSSNMNTNDNSVENSLCSGGLSPRIYIYRDINRTNESGEFERLKKENHYQKELLKKYMSKNLNYKQKLLSIKEKIETIKDKYRSMNTSMTYNFFDQNETLLNDLSEISSTSSSISSSPSSSFEIMGTLTSHCASSQSLSTISSPIISGMNSLDNQMHEDSNEKILSVSFNNDINNFHNNISISNTVVDNIEQSNVDDNNANLVTTKPQGKEIDMPFKNFGVFKFDNEFNGIGYDYNSIQDSFPK